MTTVTINQDKTISIDGKKTFVVGMSSICSPIRPLTNCQENINVNKNTYVTNLTGDITFQASTRNTLINNNILFRKAAFQTPEPNANGLFGYWQPDEPSVGQNQYPITPDMTLEQIKARLLFDYNEQHINDITHPIVLNHWKNMTEWLSYADIMMWDTYPFINPAWKSWATWDRADSIYAWEMQSWDAYFQGTELNQINKPVWTYIQANGKEDPTWGAYVPTPKEARANTYTAITLDVKGIWFWGYLVGGDYSHLETSVGLYMNPSLAIYYNNLMGELRSFNNILVLPTIDYSWQYHVGTKVSFNKNYTKTLTRWKKQQTNFNYILKQYGTTYYLIIVNKDSRQIDNVEIIINPLSTSGLKTLKTLGTIEAGSSPNRTLSINNGTFTDSFDGYAVHIYQIDTSLCPTSQCNFTITQ